MRVNQPVSGRTAVEYEKRRYLRRSKLLTLRERVDVILLGGLLAVLVLSSALLLVGVHWAKRAGSFEWEGLRPLTDERLVVNVRDKLDDQRLLAAVTHNSEGALYISQEGGAVHRFDPETELWKTEVPFKDCELGNPDFTLLRSGCGSDPLSRHVSDCPDPEPLWAVTASGALVRRLHGEWDVMVSDTVFTGINGEPIDDDDLTTAAVSRDEQWLALGTRQDGLGLYHLPSHSWIAIDAQSVADLPSAAINHLIWWRDRFWVGTDNGMVWIQFRSGQPQLMPAFDRPLKVADLDVDSRQHLWALGTVPCANDENKNDCLWLGRFEAPEQPPQVLIDQANRYEDLDLSRLIHAQLWGEKVAVAGAGGIYTYDPLPHSWHQIYSSTVQTTLDVPGNNGFYFAAGGTVGLATPNGDVETWQVPGRHVTHLSYGLEGQLLALTQRGSLYVLGLQDPGFVSLYEAAETNLDPATFRQAASYGDEVLFAGPEGALLHNVRTRSYQDIHSSNLPTWLRTGATDAFTSGAYVYFVVNGRQVYPVSGELLFDADAHLRGEISGIIPLGLPTEAKQVWVWENDGIGLLGVDGDLYHAIGRKLERVTGPGKPNLDSVRMFDAASLEEDLFLATDLGAIRYDAGSRQWNDPQSLPDGNLSVEVAAAQGKVMALSDDQRLYELRSRSPIAVIGGDIGGDAQNVPVLSDAGLSDVLESDGKLYLAVPEGVLAYDSGQRAYTAAWGLGPIADGRIVTLVDGEPLVYGQGEIWLGERPLDPDAGEVLGVSVDGTSVWTLRLGEGGSYLKGYPLHDPMGHGTTCFFRSPRATGATSIDDARSLPQGDLAVSTDNGLWFYRPAARSWYPAESGERWSNSRLYILQDQMVIVTPSAHESEITFVPLASLQLPDPCSDEPARFEADTVVARAVAVDESSGLVVWIDKDGSVVRQARDVRQTLLARAGDGPTWDEVNHLYDRGERWIFAGPRALWTYTVSSRGWNQIEINAPPGVQLDSVNLEPWQDKELIVASTREGRFYYGVLGSTGSEVDLELAHSPSASALPEPAGRLLDASLLDNRLWVLVFPDSVRFFDPAERTWIGELPFGESDASRSYLQGGEVRVVTGERGTVWWVQQGEGFDAPLGRYRLREDETTAIAGDYAVWRYTRDGVLMRCSVEAGEEYACRQHGPPPYVVDPGEVEQAFVWKEQEWLVTETGLTAYDPGSNTVLALDSRLVSFGQPESIRQQEDQLFVFRTGNLLVVDQNGQDVPEVLSLLNADQIATDSSGRFWARAAEGWQIWMGEDFVTPAGAPDYVFVADGAPPVGVDSAGLIYAWRDSMFVPGTTHVPSDQALPEVVALLPDRSKSNAWWVVTHDQVVRYEPTGCVAPTASGSAPSPGLTASPEVPGPMEPVSTPISPAPTEACLSATFKSPLPAGITFLSQNQVSAAQALSDGLRVYGREGVLVQVEKLDSDGFSVRAKGIAYESPHQVSDEWSSLSGNVVTLPNGQKAYGAVESLHISGNSLVAQRPSSQEKLAEDAFLASQLKELPSLDAGWLTWHRTQRAFSVQTASGQRTMESAELLVDGRFIFEDVEALLVTAPDVFLAANHSGVWRYTDRHLPLDDRSIRYHEVPLSSPITAAHGRFLSNGDALIPGQTRLSTEAQTLEFGVGDVVLREDIADAQITSYYRMHNSSFSADATRGFLWDANRRGIALTARGILLQTDAGLVPVDRLADFDLGPGDSSVREGQLVSEGDTAYLKIGDSWYERLGTGWRAQARDPTANRILVQNSLWNWSITEGQLSVQLLGDPRNIEVVSEAGLAFDFDRIMGAAVHEGKFYIASQAFIEIANSINEVASVTADRVLPVDLNSLEQWRNGDGGLELWCRVGNEARRWDESTQRCVPTMQGRAPWEYRRLAENDILRFTWQNDRVLKEMRITSVAGNSRWASFSFYEGRFPFDVVSSLAAFDGQFYLGTRAGLQILPAKRTAGLRAVERVDVQDSESGEPAAIERVGTPVEDESLLMVNSGSYCAQTDATGVFAECREAENLGERLRVDTSFWRWVQHPNGSVAGNYRDAEGVLLDPEIGLRGGSLPHDLIAFATICDGRAYSIWQNGWVLHHPGPDFGISSGVKTYASLPTDGEKLVCVEKEIPLRDQAIEPDLYAVSSSDTTNRGCKLSGGSWEVVGDPGLVDLLMTRVDFPPVYETDSLRVQPSAAREHLVFEQRSSDHRWHELEWETGRVQIDNWHNVLYLDQHIWAATPVGLVPFHIAANDRIAIDPDRVTVVREPALEGEECRVTDLVRPEDEVILRCNGVSHQVFRGLLDSASDTGGFERVTGADPFAGRVLIGFEDTGMWQWELVDRTQGKPGRLAVKWLSAGKEGSSESVELVSGQFPFDAVNSLAFFNEGRDAEVGTSAGWFSVVDGRFHLKHWRRPRAGSELDPSQFVAVGLARSQGQTFLCLEDRQGGSVRVTPGGEVEPLERCPEFLGSAGIWRYERDRQGLLITGIDTLRQAVSRKLVNGRFLDDWVIGLPVTGRDDAGAYYLVPTEAGVIRRDEDKADTDLLTSSLADDGEPAKVLHMLDPQTPTYLYENALYDLRAATPVVSATLNLPVDVNVTQLTEGPYDLLRVGIAHSERPAWVLLEKRPDGNGFANGMYANLAEISLYQENRARWPDLQGLTMRFEPGHIEFTAQPGQEALSQSLPPDFKLVAPILDGERLILVGRGDVQEISLSRVLRSMLP